MSEVLIQDGGIEGKKPRKNARKPSTCHPERPNASRGLCNSCYKRKLRLEHGPRTEDEKKRGLVAYRKWAAANPEKRKEIVKRWQERNRKHLYLYHLKRRYGMTEDEYNVLLQVQNNSCGICNTPFSSKPNVDHSHSTGQVRGLLCQSCNHMLGNANDKIFVLRNAIRYLSRFVS